MKKPLTFGLVTLALAIVSTWLRHWQRAAAFEPDTGLLIPGHPATWCFLGVLMAGAVALLLLAWWCVKDTELTGYLKAFSLPHPAMLAAYLLSGALLVGAGALELIRSPQRDAAQTLWAVCTVLGGLCVALVGWLNAQKRESEGRFAWPLLGPAVSGCVWLVVTYQSRTTDPTVLHYAPYLLGALCAVCACYTMAAFSFEKPQGFWCLFLCAMGIVLLATDSLGGNTIPLRGLGYMIYLAAQLVCLLTRCEVPAQLEPWTPPEAPEENDTKAEESDYE